MRAAKNAYAAIAGILMVAAAACDNAGPSPSAAGPPAAVQAPGPAPVPTPAPPALPPPISHLTTGFVFASSREARGQHIFVVESEGAEIRRLTIGRHPDWSRGRVVFEGAGGRTPPTGIHVINADGGGPYYVGEGADPSWSPDGRQIAAVVQFRWLYLLDPDRPGDAKLALAIPAGFDSMHRPAWSPDGRQIAFSSCTTIPDEFEGQLDCRIHVWPVGSASAPIVLPGQGSSPAWSPDGAQLAFEWLGSIYTTNSTGQSPRLIAPGYRPVWSPDGRLAFQAYWQGSFGTRLVIADNGVVRLLIPEADSPPNSRYSDYEVAMKR